MSEKIKSVVYFERTVTTRQRVAIAVTHDPKADFRTMACEFVDAAMAIGAALQWEVVSAPPAYTAPVMVDAPPPLGT